MPKQSLKQKKRAEAQLQESRVLIAADPPETIYARVLKMTGDCRFLAKRADDGLEIMCHIRGTMRKKIWIGVDDIVLISLRDFQDGKADCIHKYTPADARNLKKHDKSVAPLFMNEGEVDEEDSGFAFANDEDVVDIDTL